MARAAAALRERRPPSPVPAASDDSLLCRPSVRPPGCCDFGEAHMSPPCLCCWAAAHVVAAASTGLASLVFSRRIRIGHWPAWYLSFWRTRVAVSCGRHPVSWKMDGSQNFADVVRQCRPAALSRAGCILTVFLAVRAAVPVDLPGRFAAAAGATALLVAAVAAIAAVAVALTLMAEALVTAVAAGGAVPLTQTWWSMPQGGAIAPSGARGSVQVGFAARRWCLQAHFWQHRIWLLAALLLDSESRAWRCGQSGSGDGNAGIDQGW